MKIMQVMQQCPDILDFENIKNQLIVSNWNVAAVIQYYQASKNLHILLCNCANIGNTFNYVIKKDDSAMDIINHLT